MVRSTVYGHGIPFTVFKTKFGYNISHDGKWIWRAKTIDEARKVIHKTGLQYFRNSI